jgi:glycosyltransferase involved in cell wall biosynthesis
MAEQIDHGETGLFLDRPDPGAVTRQATRLLADAEERRQISQSARASVLSENDPAVIGRRLRDTITPLAR